MLNSFENEKFLPLEWENANCQQVYFIHVYVM